MSARYLAMGEKCAGVGFASGLAHSVRLAVGVASREELSSSAGDMFAAKGRWT